MLLIDVSTSYFFRHWNAMGILRTEHEVIRAFRDHLPGQGAGQAPVVFAIYHPTLRQYFRVDPAEMDSLLFDKSWEQPKPGRALDAISRPRATARQLRFLREIRALAAAGPDPTGTETEIGLARIAQDAALAQQMQRISLGEYSRVRRWLSYAARLRPSLNSGISRLDQINHLVHHGLFDAAAAQLFSRANLIDPSAVRHYISVGGFWSDDRYEMAYHARQTHGWTLHYLIYDLIPIKWRHITEPTTKETFPLALHWMLWGVDQIWTISQTTKTDLLEYASQSGYPDPDPDWVKPVYLGSEIPTPKADAETQAATLARYGLKPGGFVLMVGTLEPRKNHDFAYRLWKELNLRNPGQILPLVWVGQPGWAIAPLLEQVAQDHELPHQAIHILRDVSDADLDTLYRACRFTLYPSHYEGWGLPVVESLNYGKPCLASTAPAIVEAGQGVCETIGLFDGEAWIARAQALMQDDAAYAEAVARIARFTPCRWQDFRTTLVADYLAFCTSPRSRTGLAPAFHTPASDAATGIQP